MHIKFTATAIACFLAAQMLSTTSHGQVVTREALAADGSNILNTGTLLFGWNANSATSQTVAGINFQAQTPAGPVSDPLFGTLTFGSINLLLRSFGSAPGFTGFDVPALASEYTNANLGAMMQTYHQYGFQNNNLSSQLKLQNLTIGQEYRIQILTDVDRSLGNQSGSLRVNTGSGSVDTANFTFRQSIWTGTFTPTTTTQDINLFGSFSRASVNGIAFHAIPEPSTGLLIFGALGAFIAARRLKRS